MPKNMKASVFLALRTQMLEHLADIDAEIDHTLRFPNSQRACDRAKELFKDRKRVVDELREFGLDPDPHPAVDK